MHMLEIILHRRSIREFADDAVPEEAVAAMIEAIRWAPSAGNLQSRKFYLISNQDVKNRLARAALNQNFIARAPLVAVACLDRRIAVRYGDRGVNLYAIQDAAAATMNMMLVAEERGLGTVWVGAFNEFDVAEILELPDYLRPVAIIPIGKPKKRPDGAPKRLPVEEVAVFVR